MRNFQTGTLSTKTISNCRSLNERLVIDCMEADIEFPMLNDKTLLYPAKSIYNCLHGLSPTQGIPTTYRIEVQSG